VTAMLDPEHVVTNGPEPAYCPRCGLKHMRRPDWLCPRCGMPVETDVPQGTTRVAAAPERFPIGPRVAGGLMVAAGLALAWGFGENPTAEHRWALLAGAAALVVLGTAALVALPAARWAAGVAGAIAAVVVSEDLVRARLPDLFRDLLPAVLRAPLRDLLGDLGLLAATSLVAFAAGALLLVVARPGRVRIAVGVALSLPAIAVAVLRVLAG